MELQEKVRKHMEEFDKKAEEFSKYMAKLELKHSVNVATRTDGVYVHDLV